MLTRASSSMSLNINWPFWLPLTILQCLNRYEDSGGLSKYEWQPCQVMHLLWHVFSSKFIVISNNDRPCLKYFFKICSSFFSIFSCCIFSEMLSICFPPPLSAASVIYTYSHSHSCNTSLILLLAGIFDQGQRPWKGCRFSFAYWYFQFQ